MLIRLKLEGFAENSHGGDPGQPDVTNHGGFALQFR